MNCTALRSFLSFFLSLGICSIVSAQVLATPFERGNRNQTASYQQMLDFYAELEKFPSITTRKWGTTDSGEPLLIVFYNYNQKNTFSEDRGLVLINNGIHPGEPDGIDASMRLLRDLASGKIPHLKNTSVAVVASYNVGGMLNRNAFTRVNQNGPESYGFRGNARNFDLNRDFIKTDSRNAVSFQELVHELKPEFFIDNHVSNGADYQHTLTYIATNKERLGKALGEFYHRTMNPEVLKDLKAKGIEAIPYVNVWGTTPDKGYDQFMDSPRYATGYTSLFDIPGTVVETHMLKPYAEREEATYQNMLSHLRYLEKNWQKLHKARKENRREYTAGKTYPLQWKVDRSVSDSLLFSGYKGLEVPSGVTGLTRLKYDRNAPYTKHIPFYTNYTPTLAVKVPRFYVVPKSQWPIIAHLKRNRIQTTVITQDTLVTAEVYRIKDFNTVAAPYEGHYLHSNVQVDTTMESVRLQVGDLLVPTAQPGIKYLLETLEPQGVDSFFAWNYFDSILGQKEHYSDYVFEDTALELLSKNPDLRERFKKMLEENPGAQKSSRQQLDWIYHASPHYESSHRKYPIYRIH